MSQLRRVWSGMWVGALSRNVLLWKTAKSREMCWFTGWAILGLSQSCSIASKESVCWTRRLLHSITHCSSFIFLTSPLASSPSSPSPPASPPHHLNHHHHDRQQIPNLFSSGHFHLIETCWVFFLRVLPGQVYDQMKKLKMITKVLFVR